MVLIHCYLTQSLNSAVWRSLTAAGATGNDGRPAVWLAVVAPKLGVCTGRQGVWKGGQEFVWKIMFQTSHVFKSIYTYIYIYDRYGGNAMVHGDAQWSHITWRDESSAPKQGVALSICWMFLGRGTPVPVVARALVQLLRVEMKVPSLIGEGIGLCQEPWWFNKHFTSFI